MPKISLSKRGLPKSLAGFFDKKKQKGEKMKSDFVKREEWEEAINKGIIYPFVLNGEKYFHKIFKYSDTQWGVSFYGYEEAKRGETIFGTELETAKAHLEVGNVELVSSIKDCSNFAGICTTISKYRLLKDGIWVIPMWGIEYFDSKKEAIEYCKKYQERKT